VSLDEFWINSGQIGFSYPVQLHHCLDVAIEKTRKAIKDQDHPEKILTSFLDYKESLP
jgi:hypothetical protein